MIQLEGVSKRYADVCALAPLDLSLEPGRTTVLIGSSGSGKSTLLRLVAGLLEPDSGRVRVDGEAITPDNAPRLRLRMGYVIQEGGLFPHLTARGNVELMARQLGRPPAERARRVVELADLVHLPDDLLDRYPAQLSGGQRQRVSLMRALMLDPELLLLDEPLGSLDPMIRADLQRELREIFRALGKTVLLVTHDLREAAYFGDRVLLLRDGTIVQDGPIEALIHTPADAFVQRFVQAQSSPLETRGRSV